VKKHFALLLAAGWVGDCGSVCAPMPHCSKRVPRTIETVLEIIAHPERDSFTRLLE
jgi:hypothetical protein